MPVAPQCRQGPAGRGVCCVGLLSARVQLAGCPAALRAAGMGSASSHASALLSAAASSSEAGRGVASPTYTSVKSLRSLSVGRTALALVLATASSSVSVMLNMCVFSRIDVRRCDGHRQYCSTAHCVVHFALENFRSNNRRACRTLVNHSHTRVVGVRSRGLVQGAARTVQPHSDFMGHNIMADCLSLA